MRVVPFRENAVFAGLGQENIACRLVREVIFLVVKYEYSVLVILLVHHFLSKDCSFCPIEPNKSIVSNTCDVLDHLTIFLLSHVITTPLNFHIVSLCVVGSAGFW